MLTIELKVFSGRPNPRWQVQSLDGLDWIITNLPERHGPPPVSHRMGYRGFVVRDVARWAGEETDLFVCGEYVTVRNGGHYRFLEDESRSVESLLIAACEGHVPEAILARLRSQRDAEAAANA